MLVEGDESLMQAIEALETYEKTDPSKDPSLTAHTSHVLTGEPYRTASKVAPTDDGYIDTGSRITGATECLSAPTVFITAVNRFQAIQFLRKELAWKAGEPLFTYINLAFSSAPGDTVSNLLKSFTTDEHLNINFNTTAVWG